MRVQVPFVFATTGRRGASTLAFHNPASLGLIEDTEADAASFSQPPDAVERPLPSGCEIWSSSLRFVQRLHRFLCPEHPE